MSKVTLRAPPARPALQEPISRRLALGTKLVTLLVVVLPFLGLLAAVVLLWGRGIRWTELGLLLGMYAVTALGITVGNHRLFTHRSFEASRAARFVLAALGSMAVQAPLLRWVAVHRLHHQHSDQAGDPHSPHGCGAGVLGLLRGFWHAHLGWIFLPDPPDLERYVKDLRDDTPVRVAAALFPLWVAVGLLVPTALGWLIEGGWMGAMLGLLWGGLARICLLHHVTWSVNSVCHLWGQQPFSGDGSRNNVVFGVLAFGEGWHNNHHAFPTSARHGLRWWQLDLSYLVIRTLVLLGLAWNVKLPGGRARTG